ncbi:MAG: TAT-variant-translocated molybdopterin oxidoreductase [Candidatus Hinthialibacter antarcticus]|nr:TAT-variant-translocated molybdopterin oxidoreductase [Candidatus Hinthialibacter antarcticus]
MPSIEQNNKNGQDYWRSLNELADTPDFQEFVRREFPNNADTLMGEDRRSFLKVMAASFALAGLTSCRWPEEKIVPYAHRPDNRTPGKPVFFATSMEKGGVATGLLAKSVDGRPIKVEGNPGHPNSLGGASPQALASVLEMYDPDRSQAVIYQTGKQVVSKSWEQWSEFIENHGAELRGKNGAGLCFLSEATASPTIMRLRKKVEEQFPQSKWFEYEAISDDNEREGARAAFGQPYRPLPDFNKTKVILSLDNDFLSTHPSALALAKSWAETRDPDGAFMNRLYTVEAMFTSTGAMADHRVAMPAGQIEAFAQALIARILQHDSLHSTNNLSELKTIYSSIPETHFPADVFGALVDDLIHHQGEAVVLAGPRQSASVHAIANVLNHVLGNAGTSVQFAPAPEPLRPTHQQSIADLAGALSGGSVDTLVILGGNPAFDAPVELNFASVLSKAKHTIHLSLYRDETSTLCEWHVPRAHMLESWGDARSYDGTISSVQPLIAPLFGGKTPCEILGAMLEDEPLRAYDIVRKTFEDSRYKPSEKEWRTFLHDGVVADSAFEKRAPAINVAGLQALSSFADRETGDGLELNLYEDLFVYDGRFANNGWLQETPDFITKLTWDNAVLIAPSTADALQLHEEDVVEITVGERTIEAPVSVTPGMAPHTAALALGYGRTHGGRIADGVGVNTYIVRPSGEDILQGVTLKKTGKKYALAATQDHHAIDDIGMKERNYRAGKLIQEGDLPEYKDNPEFAKEVGAHYPKLDVWEPHEYPNHKWGLTIDLNQCTGCNSCVTACQAENNIPIVGKEQVTWGREMHWIRVDRYFKGDPDKPTVTPQPMTCVHCENAPCEQVCPVQATVHNDEGLNVMVYNRCVGTRYCSNNCPVKVRRFNFFNFNYGLKEVEKLRMNPEVTVRMRGVMEKCTMCTQRIEAVKIDAKNNRRPIRDGEIVTACEQACPTKAITFGDLNDENSRVTKKTNDSRNYSILDVLYLKPRLTYLAKIRNPHPALASASEETHEDHGHDNHS